MPKDKVLYNLTHPQKRIWYSEKMYPGTSAHNLVITLNLKGVTAINIVKQAINNLVKENDSFRIQFTETGDLSKQYIKNYKEFEIATIDLSEKESYLTYEQQIEKISVEPFHLYDSPLYYFAIIALPQNGIEILIKAHHIITDVWSWGIISNQIIDNYFRIKGQKNEILANKDSYINYLDIEDQYKGSDQFNEDRAYWLNKFNDISVTNDSIKLKHSKSIESRRKGLELSVKETRIVKDICEKYRMSVFRVFLTAFIIYKFRLTKQKKVVIGAPFHNRFDKRLANTIGMFVSTVPLSADIDERFTLEKIVEIVKSEIKDSKQHQAYPYDMLISELHQQNPGLDKINLFDTLVSYQKSEYHKNISAIKWHHHKSDFYPLVLHVSERGDFGNFLLEYDYQIDYFNNDLIDSIHGSLIEILLQLKNSPKLKVADIDIVSKKVKDKILNEFNDTKANYANNIPIPELFDKIVEVYLDKKAVIFGDNYLTYSVLKLQADKTATYLKKIGIAKDKPIALFFDRSVEFVVGTLGILKAGCAYLPIDIKYPQERINLMIWNSGVSHIITEEKYLDKLDKNKVQILLIEDILKNEIKQLDLNYGNADDVSYVMHTSGSTGDPKGVMVTHKNVIRLVNNNNFLNLDSSERILQTGAPVFDATTFEIWGSLLNGGTLYLTDELSLLDPLKLGQLLSKNSITTLWLTSPLFNQLVDQDYTIFSGLKNLLVGGDALSPKHINKVRGAFPDLNIINGYGPTENTTFSTTYNIKESFSKNIPIGKPISNSTAYILDTQLNVMPIGVEGELYVGGDGVAKGYLNNEKLTQEKFIKNPYAKNDILYKTGDKASWLVDGNIQFHGRFDFQVKIRGYRIEIGEIERTLLSHKNINEVLVVVVDKEEEKELCAYYVVNDTISKDELVKYLLSLLPAYMIPSYFIEMEYFPLTQNGKIDRRGLPEPLNEHSKSVKGEKLKTNTQILLGEIWQQILGIKSLSRNDDFFNMGGHSLRAMLLALKIKQYFSCELSLSDIFELRTIKLIADCIDEKEKIKQENIEKINKRKSYPVSSAQKRLMIVALIEGENTAYNIPIILYVNGKLNYKKAWRALLKLVNKHEALRTSFEIMDMEPVQVIHENIKPNVEFINGKNIDIKGEIDKFVRPFNLAAPSLFRVGVICKSANEHVLMIDMHHIIADGISVSILKKDFDKLYKGELLKENDIQYKDFVVWQLSFLNSTGIQKQIEYWKTELQGELPILNLPTDFKRPAKQSFKGDEYKFEISGKLLEKINNLCLETGTTLYMVLLAAYNVLLFKYTGQVDIIVGTPVVGRNHHNLQDIVGVFINTICLRNQISPEIKFNEFLTQVKKKSLKAFENQDYQFEELVNQLKLNKDLSRHPIFDTMFVVQDEPLQAFKIDNLDISAYNYSYKTAKLDLLLEATPKDSVIEFNANYCTSLFNIHTIQNVFDHYINIIDSITQNKDIKIGDIKILSENEINKIAFTYNDTYLDLGSELTINKLFSAQVIKSPNNIAIKFNGRDYTYSEIDKRANQLSRLLREKGVKPDTLVAIMINRSPDMIIAILGILKSGAAYLPVDLDFPNDRISYMLDKGKAELVITNTLSEKKDIEGLEKVYVDDKQLDPYDNTPVECINNPSDLAYVIFTSGSTGSPKGVMVEHSNIVNFIIGINDIIPFNDKTILNLTTISFDIFVLETFIPLCTGACIVLAHEGHQKNSQLLNQLIIGSPVNMLQITPSRLQLLMVDPESKNTLDKIDVIMVGGEEFPQSLFNELKKYKNLQIYNMFGPTETSVWSTIKDLTNEHTITIGEPIANTQIYILDSNKNLQPINVSGELFIAGAGVARGYWYDENLTGERFLPNPFKEGEKMYRTGDLAKLLPNGDIQFLGRTDNQVKIRGYRIELGDVENTLTKCGQIKEAAVIVFDDALGFKQLVAYYIANIETPVSVLREEMSGLVPQYMIPSVFIKIEKFPLTPNCKIDKKALPNPDIQNIKISNKFVAPASHTQKEIATAWAKVLQREKIGINDNFFELGGNSLSLVMMHNLVQAKYPKIEVADIFANPTIGKLTKLIENQISIRKTVKPLTVNFPAEFFIANANGSANPNLSVKLDKETMNALHEIAEAYNCNIPDLLLSLFIYLHVKVTKDENVKTHFYGMSGILPIEFNTSKINDLSDIFKHVSEITKSGNSKIWIVEDVKDAIINNDNRSLRTMIAVNSDDITVLTKIYEIIVCYTDHSSFGSLSLIASNKLNLNSLNKFFNNYLKLLNIITNKIYNKENTL